jgi:hypothetical protein
VPDLTLLIRRHGDPAWRKPEVSAYPTEEALESLLAGSPELLPGLAATPVVMARQVQTGAGPVDLLGVGLDGSIVVIECKLRANPEIRRAVIGQLLAYASSIWQTSAVTFEQAVGARLAQPLVAAARALAADDAWDETTFRANLERNLTDGRFRLVVAVDTITDELKRTIEYLNGHTITEIEITALEIGYLADDSIEIVVPRTFGTESIRSRQAGKGPIGEVELFGALDASCTPEGVAAVRRLFDWVIPRGGSFAWGYGIAHPSTNAWFNVEGKATCVWSCYARSTTATWDVNFEYLSRNEISGPRIDRLAAGLRAIPGVQARLAGLEAASYRKRPSLAIDAIVSKPGVVDQILASLDDLVDPVDGT